MDAQFPIARYADGFTNVRVPDRGGEHLVVDGKLGDYAAVPSCTNPLFAGTLPNPGEELCNLPDGPRGSALVVFGVIGGVPNQLVAGVTPDWKAILGEDPGSYDARGIDPHMIQSTEPRAGLPYSADALRGENGPDPVHGREFTTHGSDLQYACTFALAAYRADHKKYPNSLGDLAPKYLPTIPSDIFSGKALIYKLTETGYVFYSVGMNEQDDGGRLLSDKYEDGETRGDDLGVRMPTMKK